MVIETFKNNGLELTVFELNNILTKIIEDGRGEYKIKIEYNQYTSVLKEVQINTKANGENEIILL
jgi:hypothetical protein